MSSRRSVVILGGTGRLGFQLSQIFLSEFRPDFPNVRVPTRDPSSAKAQELAGKGAKLYLFDLSNLDQSLAEMFREVDVVVNALNSAKTPKEVKKKIAAAAIKSGASVYFLSEFGADHRLNDFPGYDHPEWEAKRELANDARALAQGKTKIIAVYNGLFLEGAFGTYAGFDVEMNRYTCVGPPSQRITFTSSADIGRTVARLAVLALDPASVSVVPDEVRISGGVTSYEDVRDFVAEIKGGEKGSIESEDLGERKGKLREKPGSVLEYIRVLMGENKLDLSEDNANALVNPGEKFWKWRSAEDELRGRL